MLWRRIATVAQVSVDELLYTIQRECLDKMYNHQFIEPILSQVDITIKQQVLAQIN